MNETAIYFGPDKALLGISSLPDSHDQHAPGVIFLNAGLLHRTGPNRLYVDVARRLAAAGYPSLRFDMSGVGDSELRGGGLLYVERSIHDVIEAMDDMQRRTGVKRFVLFGLCTGAFNAFRAALRDERVVGGVLLDGYAYPTWRSRISHYRTRVFELQRWVGYLRRRLGLADGAADAVPGDLVVFENEVVPRDRFASELGALIERNTALLMLYTRLGPLAFTYERQMHDAFPELDLDRSVDVHYFPEADHTFTLPGNRARLIETVVAWMDERFPIPATTEREGRNTA